MRFSTTLLLFFTFLQSWAAPQSKPGHSRQAVQSARLVQDATPVLNVYPNPSRGQVTVQLIGLSGHDYKLRLANILGREVRLLPLRPEQAGAGLAVDLTGLPTGLYFYSLLVNDKVVTTKRLTLQGD